MSFTAGSALIVWTTGVFGVLVLLAADIDFESFDTVLAAIDFKGTDKVVFDALTISGNVRDPPTIIVKLSVAAVNGTNFKTFSSYAKIRYTY
ncbi:hypothetical protein D3C86_1737470 [compost metagenome]